MEKAEISRHIDEGANFYLRILGAAEHMEYSDNGYYSMIKPKIGQQGGTSLFDIRLEHLPEQELREKVDEIKKLKVHTWWGFGMSERMTAAVFGENKPLPATEENDEEGCMAMLPEDKLEYGVTGITVKKVSNARDFKLWADLCNGILHGGYPMIHPEKHCHLSEEGIMLCYIAYYDGEAASVCSVIYNRDAASLEFVCTLEKYRNKGLARAVCIPAIEEAFDHGSKIITLRAVPEAKKLYLNMGFKLY
jgi:GNAT superfamily N-acetyltransferase